VITESYIPLGIRVRKGESLKTGDRKKSFYSDDTDSDEFYDISELCSGFDEFGVPENLVIPYDAQIIIFLPTIDEETEKHYWFNWQDQYTNTMVRDFSYTYKGREVAFIGAKSYEPGATDNLHVLRTVTTVDEGRPYANLSFSVDLAPPRISEVYLFSESFSYSDTYFKNNLKMEIRNDYSDWLEAGYTDSIGNNGLPFSPEFPSNQNNFFIGTSDLSPGSEIYLVGAGQYSKIDKDATLLNNTFTIGSLKAGKYKLIIEEPEKVYGKKFVEYGFTIQEPSLNRFGYWAIGIFILLMISFLVYRYLSKRRIKNLALLNKISEAELKAIRAQLNPHFLFNALNAIQNLVNKQDTERANDYIVKLSKLLRLVLAQSDDTLHALSQELETSRIYLELEQMRTPFEARIDVSSEVNENMLVPSMILQPYLENAVIHGIVNGGGDSVIVSIYHESNSCIFEISDNGTGSSKEKGTGRGMNLGKERLEILSRQLGQEMAGSVSSRRLAHGGYTVTIKLPKDL
jgi:hypothetical protein